MKVNTTHKLCNSRSCFMTLAFLYFLCLFMVEADGQYYGMQFRGHEFPLDERSGLDLTPDGPLAVKNNLDLEFYLRFNPDQGAYFGYIFRLLLGENLNIDLIHGFVPRNPNNFELIIGDKTSRIVFPVQLDSITNHWLHLKFRIDKEKGKITCFVQGKEITDQLDVKEGKSGFRLLFGTHSIGRFTTTDVPSIIVRDVSVVIDDKKRIHWPLNENQGTIVRSIPEGNNGIATNPDWFGLHHSTWQEVIELATSTPVKTAFDARNEIIYMVSADSTYMYYVTNDSLVSIPLGYPSYAVRSSDLIFDTISNNLFLYSIGNNYLISFDQASGEWSNIDPGIEPLTGYWHHNKLITSEGSLLVFGGYGYHSYKNSVMKWDPELNRFDSIDYSGNFYPRYLAGSGINPSDGHLYLIGGYGTKSGKQSENPNYYYEVLRYSVDDQLFSKVIDFKNIDSGFCFSNSIVIDSNNHIYGLYYPKYEFNNRLQLVRISIDDPEIIELGDPIDYNFLDIKSSSDLFYSRRLNALLAISTYSGPEGSTVSINSIAFPPQVNMDFTETPDSPGPIFALFFIPGGLLLLIAVIILIRLRKKQTSPKPVSPDILKESHQKRKENTILLFGGFQVFDNRGDDITGQFTPLSKKLFLYILLYTLRNEKGVSSNSLYETFWFDKSAESARNNRAVNILKLKSLLKNLDSVTISKDTGYWKFNFDPTRLHIDYYEFLQIVHKSGELKRKDMESFLSIVENRPFLNNTNADWLDSFKSDVCNEIIDTALKYINQSSDDSEFLLHLTNCIFIFDTVSEEALKLQCRLLIKQGKHSLAKSAYKKFVSEYRQLYNEDYSLSFNQVIEE